MKSISRSTADSERKWTKPDPNIIKVNVDAAFHEEDGSRATTAIIRDEKGRSIAAQCKYIQFATDVVIVEAMPMRDGLTLVNAM